MGETLIVNGPYWGHSGYAELMRNITKGLIRAGKSFKIDATRWIIEQTSEIGLESSIILNNYRITEPIKDPNFTVLQITIPTEFVRKGPRHFGYTMIECDGIVRPWAESINANTDGIIVPSIHNQNFFKESGVNKDIFTCGLGVDTISYLPQGEKFNLGEEFKFLNVSSWHARKNIEGLIKAFCDEFDENEKVRLYIKADMKGTSSFEPNLIIDDIKKFKEKAGKPNARISLLYGIVHEDSMPSFYRSFNCYVNSALGEGWDLPRLQAMMCGVPAIGTSYGGTAEYFKGDLLIVDHKRQTTDFSSPHHGRFTWGVPVMSSLRARMRQIFSEEQVWKEKYLLLRNSLAKEYDVTIIAHKLWNILFTESIVNEMQRKRKNECIK